MSKYQSQQTILLYRKVPPDNNTRHIFICKKHDTKLKIDIFICDVVGKFYAVIQNEVYTIGFKHSFEIDFSVAQKGKEEGGDSLDL
jgi:hypothetical protein